MELKSLLCASRGSEGKRNGSPRFGGQTDLYVALPVGLFGSALDVAWA